MTGTPAVVTHDLTVAYGRTRALDGVDLTLTAGQLVAVIGPNGSGKSTLLSAIAGLVRPTRGRVEVFGHPPSDAHEHLAYVLQLIDANEAVPLTVREVVTMGRYAVRGAFGRLTRQDRRLVDEALGRLDLDDLAGRHLTELSGGQRQRVFVAQGLAQQADLLLLDEPATGLDLPTSQLLAGVVDEERAAGRTVVVTTHDLADAGEADHVVLLSTRVVAVGRPADVLTAEHLADAYGGHLHRMDDGTLVVDDPHHHHGTVTEP